LHDLSTAVFRVNRGDFEKPKAVTAGFRGPPNVFCQQGRAHGCATLVVSAKTPFFPGGEGGAVVGVEGNRDQEVIMNAPGSLGLENPEASIRVAIPDFIQQRVQTPLGCLGAADVAPKGEGYEENVVHWKMAEKVRDGQAENELRFEPGL